MDERQDWKHNHFVSDDLKTMSLPHSGMGARLSPYGGGAERKKKATFIPMLEMLTLWA